MKNGPTRLVDGMTIALGRIGIWRHLSGLTSDLVTDVEALGYGAIWVGGSPDGDLGGVENLLATTDHIAVATGIVNVWKEAEVSRTVPVRPDGKISLPLLNDVQAAGLTPQQLAGSIRDGLKKFVSEPEVTVIVSAVNSRRCQTSGIVNCISTGCSACERAARAVFTR